MTPQNAPKGDVSLNYLISFHSHAHSVPSFLSSSARSVGKETLLRRSFCAMLATLVRLSHCLSYLYRRSDHFSFARHVRLPHLLPRPSSSRRSQERVLVLLSLPLRNWERVWIRRGSFDLSCVLLFALVKNEIQLTLFPSSRLRQGEDHSITSFQKRDTAFREHWFNTHPVSSQGDPALQSNGLSQKIGKKVVSEHDIETEFWRLVESEEETVEVEYGADVHSTIHGR